MFPRYLTAAFRISPGNSFGEHLSSNDAADAAARRRFVVFGELHGQPAVVRFQTEILQRMVLVTDQRINVVMEHFNFDMQNLLDAFSERTLDLPGIIAAYEQIGTECHDIRPYAELLEFARAHPDRITLHGGFLPRPYAKLALAREGVDEAVALIKEKGYIADDESLQASEGHYNMFESKISGRNMHDHTKPPMDAFRPMFPSQVIKDCSMAWKLQQLLAEKPHECFFIILGTGHMAYDYGVPERIFQRCAGLREESYRIYTIQTGCGRDLAEFRVEELQDIFGVDLDPADLCFIFSEDKEVDPEAGKRLAALHASNVAALDNNIRLRKAEMAMAALGYGSEEVSIAGRDAQKYKGLGNPHRHVSLRAGETVVDLGSGPGIDCFVASARVGPGGHVVGLDTSPLEVLHALNRARERGLENVRFLVGDMEKTPLEGGSADCVISSGGFCETHNKKATIHEIYRVLRPGGRFAVYTRTADQAVESKAENPYLPIEAIAPLCEGAGFQDVEVHANGLMRQITQGPPLPEVKQRQPSTSRQRRKGGVSKENKGTQVTETICTRLVITGTKPH